MRPHALYLPALVVATFGAAVVPVSLFFEPVREHLIRPLTLIAAGVITVLFLRMLFDAKIRKGVDAANIELRGGNPWPASFRMHRSGRR